MREPIDDRVRDYSDRDRYDAPRYDSHYDEGEDPVDFVNVIDVDIPFFQLVWLIFKILLASLVAFGMLSLLAGLVYWVLQMPAVQDALPNGADWFRQQLNRF